MRRAIAWFGLGLLAFVLAAEALCRLLPVSTATDFGYRVDEAFMTYPPHHRWRTATGWDLRRAQTIAVNNLGFASERDDVPDPRAVVVIGDSYVEGSMLAVPERLGPQIERALGGQRPVYDMGLPGTSLLDYAERIRFAAERLQVRDFVLLVEAGDVPQSVCDPEPRDGVCLDARTLQTRRERRPEASALKRVARHSAFAQYLFSQLKIDPRRLWRQAIEQARPGTPDHGAPSAPGTPSVTGDRGAIADLRLVDAVTNAFFARVQSYRQGRLVLLVDGQRRADRPAPASARAARQRFMELARAAGAQVVDLEPAYGAYYAGSTLSLDVAPDDAHLNAVGLRLLAREAATALQAGR
jgi:hypothetical protein